MIHRDEELRAREQDRERERVGEHERVRGNQFNGEDERARKKDGSDVSSIVCR